MANKIEEKALVLAEETPLLYGDSIIGFGFKTSWLPFEESEKTTQRKAV